jgi:hypothetical protein
MNKNGAEFHLITAATTLRSLDFKTDDLNKKILIENLLLKARTKAAEMIISSFQGLFGLTDEEIEHNYLEIVGQNISESVPNFVEKHCMISPRDLQITELQNVLEGRE